MGVNIEKEKNGKGWKSVFNYKKRKMWCIL